MSMLSAQCDELREVAYKVDEYQMGRERVPLKTAAIMREAADTILSLRDRAQDLQAMNAKLRKERDMYRDLVGMMGHPDLNAQLQAENAKLRNEVDNLMDFEHLTSVAVAYAGCDECGEYKQTMLRLFAENAKLREQVERLQPKDCEGNVLDIADTVNMLRSEYDGDHEWDDVVVELALTKWGGDRWIVRGSKGEAWACDCAKTGYDEDAYEGSDDVEPIANPTLIEAENAKLRELATYALKHIIEFECEEPNRERLRGKPCEDCADYGSSDCPKCMPRMFGVSGIEVD